MRMKLGVCTFGLWGALCSPVAQAAEVGFLGGVGFQVKQLFMEQSITKLKNQPDTSGDLTAAIGVLNLQGVVFYDVYYLALKYEMGLTEDSYESDIPFTGSDSGLNTEVTRNDLSLSVGAKLNERISVFGGYMEGKTELTPEALDDCPPSNTVTTDNCYNPASTMLSDGLGEYRQTYEEKGFFVGVSASWDVVMGKVSTSLAYALMDGEYKDNYRDLDDGFNKFDYRGDSQGLSAAVSWLAPITETVAYFVDFRVQKYDMDAKDYSNKGNFDNSEVETSETIVGLTGGIQMLF